MALSVVNGASPRRRLAVLITHPIQYFRPVFAEIASDPHVELLVVFGCDHGLRARVDPDFGVSFAWDCSPTEGFEHVFISQRPLKDLSLWPVALQLAWSAWRRIRCFRPDAVLVFAYTPAWVTLTTMLLSFSGQRLFLRADGSDRAFPRGQLKRLLKDGLLRLWYRQFAHVFPIGSDSTTHFRRLGVSQNACTPVRYSVDFDFFADQVRYWSPQRAQLRRKHGIPEQALVLLWSAKITAVKHPILLLQALDQLPEVTLSRLFLLVVGDGPLRTVFENGAKQRLPGRCCFMGFRNQSELGAYYAMADALVFPSIMGETWGLVVNEALQFGCAVIASDHPGSVRDLLTPLASAPKGSAAFRSNDALAFSRALANFVELNEQGFVKEPVAGLPHPRDLAHAVIEELKEESRGLQGVNTFSRN